MLYLDEIQYFNKKQQQSLLEFIENGKITLIASTTENPYFYVYNAILSRSTVFEFKELTAGSVRPAVERAVRFMERREGVTAVLEEGVVDHISGACGGDVRKAINSVELLFWRRREKRIRSPSGWRTPPRYPSAAPCVTTGGRQPLRHPVGAPEIHPRLRPRRGRALPWTPSGSRRSDFPCRRLLVTAAEDIGLAFPQAIAIVKACVDSALQLGLPEARIPLAEAAILLATAPKSNSAVMAVAAAMEDIKKGKSGEIPRELQNVHADSAGLERSQNYKYPHDFPNRWVRQQYLPDAIKDAKYYEYGDNKTEQAAKKYWDLIKNGEET